MKNESYKLGERLLYGVWNAIKRRCYNDRDTAWEYYGGKGITVCDEWLLFYAVFHAWSMQNGYARGLVIDRIDSDGNYEPSNCRWITPEENSRHASEVRKERGNYKITREIASYIKRSILSREASCRSMAEKFGIGITSVTNITTGKTWAEADPVGSIRRPNYLVSNLHWNTRVKITILLEIGDSCQKIADEFCIPLSTVRRIKETQGANPQALDFIATQEASAV